MYWILGGLLSHKTHGCTRRWTNNMTISKHIQSNHIRLAHILCITLLTFCNSQHSQHWSVTRNPCAQLETRHSPIVWNMLTLHGCRLLNSVGLLDFLSLFWSTFMWVGTLLPAPRETSIQKKWWCWACGILQRLPFCETALPSVCTLIQFKYILYIIPSILEDIKVLAYPWQTSRFFLTSKRVKKLTILIFGIMVYLSHAWESIWITIRKRRVWRETDSATKLMPS